MIFRRMFKQNWLWLAAITPVLAWPIASLANPVVTTDSAVFVERRGPDSLRQLEPAQNFARGERIVTILRWHRLGGNGGFTITNPLPRAVAYQRSSRTGEQVSVDGGRTWGRLGELEAGARLATPEDVTHIRWRIPPQVAMQGAGQIAYSGFVR